MNEKGFVSEKRFVSKKNLSRAWRRLFGKVLNSKEEIEANTSENMIAGAEAVKEVYSSLQDSNTSESFNFGSLNGVRGFFTDPSKADDSFVPFNHIGDMQLIKSNGESKFNNTIIPVSGKCGIIFGYGFSSNISYTKITSQTQGVTIKTLEDMSPTDWAEGRRFTYYLCMWIADANIESIEISGGISVYNSVGKNQVYEII